MASPVAAEREGAAAVPLSDLTTAELTTAELTTADLTPEQLAAWQAALGELGTPLQIRLKSAGAQRAQDGATTLQAGLEALLTGQAASVQVRYLYEGHWWADTLTALPEGCVRLLRAALPDLP